MKVIKLVSLLAAMIVLLVGCTENDNSSITGQVQESKVEFEYALSAVFSQIVSEEATRATEAVIGEMTITDVVANTTERVDWYVSLDEDLVTITSNMTRTLKPSIYTFDLTIAKGNYKYVGSAQNIVIGTEDQTDIELRVKPIIGSSAFGFRISNLPHLKFNYLAEELADLADPKIGYTINGGNEEIIDLNADGDSDVYLNLTEGNHTVRLKLYDGNSVVGKSQSAQENIVIGAGLNLTMDLIPLSAEATISVPVDKAEGSIYVVIPDVVIAEAGAIENLKTIVTLTSANNSDAGSLELSNLTPDGTGYRGSVVYPSLAYDNNATITVTFIDITTEEVLGSSIFNNVTIDILNRGITGSLDLIRRAIVTGNLLATTGVNVFDQNGLPVQGAEIYFNNELVGITGNFWGTEGYFKFHHPKGTVVIKAINPATNKITTKQITVTPLSVNNVLLNLTNAVYNPANGHTYEFIETAYMSWDEAKAACEAEGGYLATVTSGAENNFIGALIPAAHTGWVYLGGQRDANDQWQWITGESWSYTNWTVNEPTNTYIGHESGEDKLSLLSSNDEWNDLPNDLRPLPSGYVYTDTYIGYILEKDF